MNTLSWLIYLADICDNLNKFFAIIGVLQLLGGLILFGVYANYMADKEFWRGRRGESQEIKQKYNKIVYAIPLVGLIMIFFSTLIPDKNTVMYIAASEYGQSIIMNKQVQDLTNPAFELLKEWIKNETIKINNSEKK
jgi:formate hydrogenlyase subunit 3/multisubunit Na+/H+ antiporter MnhD subunit